MNIIITYLKSVIIGGIVVLLINVFLVERVIIPDICYYHSHDPNFFIETFYDFPSSEGSHPVPSIFNLSLSFITGGTLGFFFKKLKNVREYPT